MGCSGNIHLLPVRSCPQSRIVLRSERCVIKLTRHKPITSPDENREGSIVESLSLNLVQPLLSHSCTACHITSPNSAALFPALRPKTPCMTMNVKNQQNQHRRVWGSLSARLEGLSDELFVEIDNGHNGNGRNNVTCVFGSGVTMDSEQQEAGNRIAYAQNMTSCAIDGRNGLEVAAMNREFCNIALGAPSSFLGSSNPAPEETHLTWNFDECHSYGINRLVSEISGESPNDALEFISLRQWIKGALKCIGKNDEGSAGTMSSAYLAAALRIAMSMAEQIYLAETFASEASFEKLAVLPNGTCIDWAGFVKVRLKTHKRSNAKKASPHNDNAEKTKSREDAVTAVEVDQERLGRWKDDFIAEELVIGDLGIWDEDRNKGKLSEATSPNSYCQRTVASSSREQFSSFCNETSLQGRNLKQNVETDKNCKLDSGWAEEVLLHMRPLPLGMQTFNSIRAKTDEDKRIQDDSTYKEQLKFVLEFFNVYDFNMIPSAFTTYATKQLSCRDARSPIKVDDLGYLHVDSATIQGPECNGSKVSNGDVNSVEGKAKRIYQLGLVFYELFSGGRKPPSEAMALCSMDGAYASLQSLIISENENNRQTLTSESELSKRQAASSQGNVCCQVLFDSLKLIGIPGALCHLILNMLDCINGDVSGNECYTTMADVYSDLQFMIDKPQKFLHDMDMGKLTLSGLQMNEIIIPREHEFESIQSCYKRSVLQSYEIAVIAGESGTGKSWLARRVGRFVVAQGGFFLSGKFDQMHQDTPFSVLASAFDQYCDALIKERDSDWAKLVVHNLNVALGPDASHLIKMIPKLSQILRHNLSIGESVHDQNSGHALQRLCYFLCQFVDVICSSSISPVTLCLDDIQWADTASILVLKSVLTKEHKNFFFLACWRDVEMQHNDPFGSLLENVRTFGINTTIVKLRCMKKSTLNEMVSDLLCLPPRLVRSLSDVLYSKTKGNPLFFSQMMLSLTRDGLLSLSLSRQRWVWNEEEIQSRKLPDDVALYFIRGISRLPLEVQLALFTLSMFGASVKYEYVEALESKLNSHLLEPLKIAAAEGLVSNLNGSFHFCHDRIQEAAYDMIKQEVRCREHMLYGRCLVVVALHTGDNEMLFTAVNQINLGGSSAASGSENLVKLADYNLIAGKRSMELSDFSSAYNFFSHGMEFLPDTRWEDHYQLTLELFELASKTALATGNIHSLRMVSEKVLQNARCFEDKLNTHYIMISSLAYASKIPEALKIGCAILSQLGESIPRNLSEETSLQHHIEQTQAIIRGRSKNDILNHHLMTDTKKLAAMKFLAQLEIICFIVKPSLQPFLSSKMVQLTISHGLSPMSPIGFAYFGSLLATRGNIRMGHQLALLAKSLLNRLDTKEIAGEVICMVAQMQCFVGPMQSTGELHMQGESASMAVGNIHWACINRMLHWTAIFWSGVNLSTAKEAASKACRFMREQQHKTSLLVMLIVLRTVLALIGKETEAPTCSELSRSVEENNNPSQLMIFSFHTLYISFLLNNDTTLKKHAETFFQLEPKLWLIHSSSIGQTFIGGLVSFRIYRETGDSLWAERGKRCKADMKLWTEEGTTWNFQHKLLLLEAEESYSYGDLEVAHESYVNAISLAKSHKFLNDEALACELAAKFYLAMGNVEYAMEHFHLAHQKYLEWGAVVKAEQLFEFATMFPNFAGVPDSQRREEMDQGKRRADGTY